MAAKHGQRFVELVDSVRGRITEWSIHDVVQRQQDGEPFVLIDVREESEFATARIPGSVHLGKGIIERDVESRYPDLETCLVLYCGGGYRSALAAHNLTLMGYLNVVSMDGGFRGWREAGYEIEPT